MSKQISNNGLFPQGTILGVINDKLVPLGFMTREKKQNLLHIGNFEPLFITDDQYIEAQERVDRKAGEASQTFFIGGVAV